MGGLAFPVSGPAATLVGMKPNPGSMVIAFIVLDVLVIAGCAYLLVQGRAGLHRRG